MKCTHPPETSCMNCRPGLTTLPGTYVTHYTIPEHPTASVSVHPTLPDFGRIELELLLLREEIRQLSKLFKQAMTEMQ